MAAVEWSNLPKDLLISVAERLVSFEDLFAFGAVCGTWRAASWPAKSAACACGPHHQAPRLVSFHGGNNEMVSRSVEIESLSQWRPRQTHQIGPTSRILEAETVLSSLGWLLTKSCVSQEVRLFNPLTRAEISLPSQPSLIGKFVLSASPSSSDDYKVIVLVESAGAEKLTPYGYGLLQIWRPGKATWTGHLGGVFSDVVFHDGLVWTMDVFEATFLAMYYEDVEENPAMVRQIFIPVTYVSMAVWDEKRKTFYVVESEGEILVVRADREGPDHSQPLEGLETVSFQMYKQLREGKKFERMVDLGDRTLFLGNKTSSFSVNASDFPGCQANCIYFAEDYPRQNCISKGTSESAVVGIFSLIDETFKRYLFRFDNHANYRDYFLSPLWVQPTLWS